jgi:hypothetical protein
MLGRQLRFCLDTNARAKRGDNPPQVAAPAVALGASKETALQHRELSRGDDGGNEPLATHFAYAVYPTKTTPTKMRTSPAILSGGRCSPKINIAASGTTTKTRANKGSTTLRSRFRNKTT